MSRIRSILFKRDGSITLLAALSMTFLIIFFMVLIDISRILVYSKLTESSTKLASRSVMSAYDFLLYERYGLFGKGGTDGQVIAEQIMKNNVTPSVNIVDISKSIKLAPIEIQTVDVIYDRFLGEHDELENQIIEEMKYKAPIDFTLEIIETFADLEQSSKTAKGLVASLNTIQQLFEKREKTLESLYETQTAVAELEQTFPLTEGFSTIIDGYSSYISNLNEAQTLQKELEQVQSQLGDEPSHDELAAIEQLQKQISSVQTVINQYLSSANKALLASEQHQNQMNTTLAPLAIALEENMNLARTLNTTITIQYEMLLMQQQTQSASSDQASTDLSQLHHHFSTEGLIRSPEFMDQYEQELNTQLNAFYDYINKASLFTEVARSALQQPNLNQVSSTPMNSSYTQLQASRSSIYTSYLSPATVLMQRAKQINTLDPVKEQLKENKQQYKQLLGDMNYLAQLAAIFDKLQQDKSSFDQVHSNAKRNLERNLLLLIDKEQLTATLTDDGNDNAMASLEQFTGLIASMKNISKQLQTHMYRNEYIIQRFKHLPLGQLSKLSEGQIQNINFHDQAVEYIILGFSEPSANVTLVMAEIFAIRLAIRTIEGLIANKHLANPVLIISTAILHGLQHAIKDMNELIDEGESELSKYAKVDVSYRHYLRLLLSIHGLTKSSMLSRIVAVIEQDLKLDFMQVPTSSIVMAETKMRLWMLPSLSRFASSVSYESIYVENGYYEKMDYASSSY